MRKAFADMWKDSKFLADYPKVIHTEPILVTGAEGQEILSAVANVRPEARKYLDDYISKLTK